MIEKAVSSGLRIAIFGLLRSSNFHGIHAFIYYLSHPRDPLVTPRDHSHDYSQLQSLLNKLFRS